MPHFEIIVYSNQLAIQRSLVLVPNHPTVGTRPGAQNNIIRLELSAALQCHLYDFWLLPILALPCIVWYPFIFGRDRDPVLENQADVELMAMLFQRLGESNVDRWRVV